MRLPFINDLITSDLSESYPLLESLYVLVRNWIPFVEKYLQLDY
jgi:hypothetical protein